MRLGCANVNQNQLKRHDRIDEEKETQREREREETKRGKES